MNRTMQRLLMTVLLLTGCDTTAPPPPPDDAARMSTLSPDQSAKAREALVEWFECEECEEGQLQAVVQYGPAVVGSLRATLLGGPGPATVELTRRELEKRYSELQKYQEERSTVKVASSREAFVEMYLGRLDTQYRVRAAQALAAIGGAAAKRALEERLAKSSKEDERLAIRAALGSMK